VIRRMSDMCRTEPINRNGAATPFCQSIRNDNNIMTVISTRIHPGVCIVISSNKAMGLCLFAKNPGR
jgi:hypothetical protein